MDSQLKLECASHHIQQEFCRTRPEYRQGRMLKSVKSYSICDESQYLIANGIPDINIIEEFKLVCSKYGEIEQFNVLNNYPTEKFESVFIIKYANITNARFAKNRLDNMSFYGGVLHVFYAPEKETIQDTRQKLEERRRKVNMQLSKKFTNFKKKERSKNVKPYEYSSGTTKLESRMIGPQIYHRTESDNLANNLRTEIKFDPNLKTNAYNETIPISIARIPVRSCQPSIDSLKLPIQSLKKS